METGLAVLFQFITGLWSVEVDLEKKVARWLLLLCGGRNRNIRGGGTTSSTWQQRYDGGIVASCTFLHTSHASI